MSQLRKEPWGHLKAVAWAPVTPGTCLFTPSSGLSKSPEALCGGLAGVRVPPRHPGHGPCRMPGAVLHLGRPDLGCGREHGWRAGGALSSGLGPGEALRAPGALATPAGQTKHQVQRGQGSWRHGRLAHPGLCPLQPHGPGGGDGRPPAPGRAPSVRSARPPARSRIPACICLGASPP